MAAYTVVNVTRSGTGDLAPVAVAASDTFANDGNTFLYVVNADASVTNLTFTLATDPNASEPTQSTSADNIAVAAGESELIGPFPTGKFGTTVTVAYSNQTAITAAAYRLTAG
jgi:hypothetical protein